MRLLNYSNIKVGDWIEWCSSDGIWDAATHPVCNIDTTGKERLVWWNRRRSAWPVSKCRKVKGPDETTERRTC